MFLTALWSPVEVRRTFDQPADVVFGALSDPYTYPRWLVGAQRMRAVDSDFPREGSSFHHSVGPIAETTVDDQSRVLAVDAPWRLELRVVVGPVDGVVEFLVGTAEDGCTVRFRERPSGPAVVFTPFTRLALRVRNTESLRRLDRFLAESALGAG